MMQTKSSQYQALIKKSQSFDIGSKELEQVWRELYDLFEVGDRVSVRGSVSSIERKDGKFIYTTGDSRGWYPTSLEFTD